jgi:hypothetical protein
MQLLPKPLLHDDRRRLPRIGLDLYGYEHLSLLVIPHQSLEARLLDISPCGARLSLPLAVANLGLGEGDVLTFNPRLGGQGPLYRDLACRVRWFSGWQMGLSLDQDLPVCVTDIFKLLNMVWRA